MTVSEQIIQVIEALCEKFGIAIDWTGTNVLPYLEVLCGKLIAFEIGTSIFWIVLWVVFGLASIIASVRLVPFFNQKIQACGRYDDDEGWWVAMGITIALTVVINIIAITIIGFQIYDIIKCLTFPEIYVFEYIQKLLTRSSL